MSGGSYDYLYSKVEDMSVAMRSAGQPAYRRAFGAHLALVAQAMHHIEWVDSSDMGDGDDKEAIQAALGKDALRCELEESVKDARRVLAELHELLEKAVK